MPFGIIAESRSSCPGFPTEAITDDDTLADHVGIRVEHNAQGGYPSAQSNRNTSRCCHFPIRVEIHGGQVTFANSWGFQ
jgi:hypothetical protein